MFDFFSKTPLIFWIIICLICLACLGFGLVFFLQSHKKSPKKKKDLLELLTEQDSEFSFEDEGKSELELLLEKMQEDLEGKNEPVDSFEKEQEEKSIISYQELMQANQKPFLPLKEQTIEIKEPQVEPVPVILETPVALDEVIEQSTLEKPMIPNYYEPKRFQTSEFISPIYGKKIPEAEPTKRKTREEIEASIRGIKKEEPPRHALDTIELERTLDMARLTEEIKKNDQFLKALKEFRKNLE